MSDHAEEKHWERFHANGLIATVGWTRASNEYVASMRDPHQQGIDTVPVRPGLSREQEAKATADRLAHPQCDGTCQPWGFTV